LVGQKLRQRPQEGKKNMKKQILASLVMGGLLSVAALSGCNSSSKENIHLQLVPSNDATTLLTRAQALEPILEKYVPDYTWTVDVGASYAATTAAVAAGQLDGGFLTASGYAQCTIEHPDEVEVLLSASRAGYKVQADDFPGFDKTAKATQLKAMNGQITAKGVAVTDANKADAYDYEGQQSDTQVSFYSGIIFCLKDSVRTSKGLPALDSNSDGTITLKELHDNGTLPVDHMGSTSGSGMIYPTKTLYDEGYTLGFKDVADYNKLTAAEQAKAFRGVKATDYPTSVDDVMTGKVDAACGFMDTRYGSAYVQANGKYHNDASVFTNTYTVAITDPIMNDTISVNSKISDARKAAIKKAFKAAVTDGSKDTEGTGAYLLYQIYSHTGYVDAKDSDYDAARDMYNWTKNNTEN
jgi:ABC-type phosphate/phosphonate transport system substrate-binding protein